MGVDHFITHAAWPRWHNANLVKLLGFTLKIAINDGEAVRIARSQDLAP